MNAILFSIVIPTYNRTDLLSRALDSLAKSQRCGDGGIEVLVVDNNSDHDVEAVIQRQKRHGFPFDLRCVVEPAQGVSRARNAGIAHAHGAYVVFMDDDQQIDRAYLAELHDVFEQNAADCVGGPVRYFNASNLPAWLPGLIEGVGQFEGGRETRLLSPGDRWLNGGNMAVKRDALIAVGGFDDSMGRQGHALFAHADHEIQERLHAAGKRIVYSPALVQYHDLRPDRLKKRYWRRNRFDWGRTEYRHPRHSDPADIGPRLFGAPRWYWRQLAACRLPLYLKSIVANAGQTERFNRELDIYDLLGRIHEARVEYRTCKQRQLRR